MVLMRLEDVLKALLVKYSSIKLVEGGLKFILKSIPHQLIMNRCDNVYLSDDLYQLHITFGFKVPDRIYLEILIGKQSSAVLVNFSKSTERNEQRCKECIDFLQKKRIIN